MSGPALDSADKAIEMKMRQFDQATLAEASAARTLQRRTTLSARRIAAKRVASARKIQGDILAWLSEGQEPDESVPAQSAEDAEIVQFLDDVGVSPDDLEAVREVLE